MTKRWMGLVLVLLFIAQGSLTATALAGDSESSEKQLRVNATTLNVRSGPGTTNSVVTSLTKGAVVTLVEDRGEWMMIRMEDGTSGWAASKFLEVVTGDEESGALKPGDLAPPPAVKIEASKTEPAPAEEKGGSAFRGVLKWGCFLGAAAFGGLAWNEHSQGNSSYDDYKSLFGENRKTEAEASYQDAKDHDSKAQTYMIAGGSLFGLFLLQQFVFHGGGDDQAELGAARTAPAFAWNPATGEMRAALSVRF